MRGSLCRPIELRKINYKNLMAGGSVSGKIDNVIVVSRYLLNYTFNNRIRASPLLMNIIFISVK